MADEEVLNSAQQLEKLKNQIQTLYLKIKRCSKDTNLTESQYVNNVETQEDREERRIIGQLDPFVVLQYISSSIDVIINLKFEDIENKMLQKANDEMKNPGKAGNEIEDIGDLEVGSFKQMKFLNSPGKDSSASYQDTPEQIRKKVQK